MLKRIIIVSGVSLVLIAVLSLAPLRSYEPVKRTNAGSPSGYDYTCQDGEMPIGNGACRIIPTGCPYGDSVPLDKCEPWPEEDCNGDWTKCEPKKEAKSGDDKTNNKRPSESKKEYSTCDSN